MYKITRPQFLFRAIMIYRVLILKFFLPNPSGPAKNKKTFKKWTQCLHHSFYVITNLSCFKWMTVITKTQIKNNSQHVRFADGSSGNAATNTKNNAQSPTKDSKNGQQTKTFTPFHKTACGVFPPARSEEH